MPQILAVNAIMIYADSPAELAKWYEDNLGIRCVLNANDGCYYGELGAWADGSQVHFGIYPARMPLGKSARPIMVNYRVADLSEAIKELRDRGIGIENIVEESYGSFAHLRDGEGNLIELWMDKEQKKAG